ncbi:MAG: bifunctional demethylmenaquinone methyltransferase/2-methoxy-6-polyprenyl-1,4-benzoquinol methylase UbiE [Bacteroidota bacterium]
MNKHTIAEKEKVTGMFDSIAGRYDFLNRFLSFRSDVRWRKKMIRMLIRNHPKNVLDVATGTADVAITCARNGIQKIVGVDLSEKMLEKGREKISALGMEKQIQLFNGDAENIPQADESFDAVTVAFGVRNFENLEKGLAEMLRILRPGGAVWILEFSKPKNAIIRNLYFFYFRNILPIIGKSISGNRKAYRYLFDSSMHFPANEKFVDILNQTGFCNSGYRRFTFGVACLYYGIKPLSRKS